MPSNSGYCAVFASNLIGSFFFGTILVAVIIVAVCASSRDIFRNFWPKATPATHIILGILPAIFFIASYTCTPNFKAGGWNDFFSIVDDFPFYILTVGFLTGLAGLVAPARFGIFHRCLLLSYLVSTGTFSLMATLMSLNQ